MQHTHSNSISKLRQNFDKIHLKTMGPETAVVNGKAMNETLLSQLLTFQQQDNNNKQEQHQLEWVLARAALRLRQMVSGKVATDADEEAKDAEEEEEEERSLWRRIRVLVEFGLSDDMRLLRWLEEMARGIAHRLPPAKGIATIADRLEWVVLRLGLHSLPAICAPRVSTPTNSHPLRACTANANVLPPTFHAEAEVTARVDLAGGWTDTPPITYQCSKPPAVLNLAIKVNGKRPLRCRCSRLEQFRGVFYSEGSAGKNTSTTLHFPDAEAVFSNCDRPTQPGSLLCSILVIAGIAREQLVSGERLRTFAFGGPGRGLHVRTESDLPHGSGLGASSILSGAMLAALWRLCGRPVDTTELVHAVLRVEQLHTTGGGWQDQIGGCVPGGFKLGTVQRENNNCAPDGGFRKTHFPECVENPDLMKCLWRAVPVSDALRQELRNRLALVYTGKTRLAKNLLREVLLSWSGRDQRILHAVERLSDGARRAEQMLLEGKFPSQVCDEYNELKKTFTASTEPPKVTELIRSLSAIGLIEVAWMAGAGGGGFLYVWMVRGRSVDELKQFLESDQKWTGMSVWKAEMEDSEPMLIR